MRNREGARKEGRKREGERKRERDECARDLKRHKKKKERGETK